MAEKRRPGRPPKPEPSGETARLELKLTPELRRQIRMAAAAADVGMGAWVKAAVQEKLEREQHATVCSEDGSSP